MGRNYALTVPQIKQAAQMYDKGYSLHDIGAHFKASPKAVKNALLLVGVTMRERKHAVEVALLRRSIEKPAPASRGWTWLNPANADQWQVRQAA